MRGHFRETSNTLSCRRCREALFPNTFCWNNRNDNLDHCTPAYENDKVLKGVLLPFWLNRAPGNHASAPVSPAKAIAVNGNPTPVAVYFNFPFFFVSGNTTAATTKQGTLLVHTYVPTFKRFHHCPYRIPKDMRNRAYTHSMLCALVYWYVSCFQHAHWA